MKKLYAAALLLAACGFTTLAAAPKTTPKTIYRKGWIDFNKNGRMDPYEDPSRSLDAFAFIVSTPFLRYKNLPHERIFEKCSITVIDQEVMIALGCVNITNTLRIINSSIKNDRR